MKSPTCDAVALVAMLKTCTQQKDLCTGLRVHSTIVKEGFLARNVFIGSTLVNMYAKCSAPEKAQGVFDELSTLNTVSWNALLSGYAQHGLAQEALMCFERMQLDGFPADAVTFTCVLKACGSIGALDEGCKIHSQIMKEHLLETDIVVAGALVDMYCKCGALERARKAFDELPEHDLVLWTALITGYAQSGRGEDALRCFEQMQTRGFCPDAMTYSCILKACGSIGASEKGREIHAQILSNRLLADNLAVANALVDMYAKCGVLEKAREVFDELPSKDTVSWNALIVGYAHHGQNEEALNCFETMSREGLLPDMMTLVGMLKACARIGTAYKGLKLHLEIVKLGMQEDVGIGMALIIMYASCCMLAEARALFESLQIRDAVSWNTFMEGYAQLGNGDIVLDLFRKMIDQGIEPNPVTLTVVLNTCNHTGLLDVGQQFLDVMSRSNRIILTVEHHSCIMDLYGRLGHVEKAVVVAAEMPFFPDLTIWHTLMGACKKWGSRNLAKWAFEHAIELDKHSIAAYVHMSNIFVAAGGQDDATKVKAMQLEMQGRKKPGHCEWMGHR